MLESVKLRFILIGALVAISIVLCLPNVYEPAGALRKYLPLSDKMHLGLDLKGGMQLLLQLDTAKLMENMVQRKVDALKNTMIDERIVFLGLDKKEYSILVSIRPQEKDKLNSLVGTRFPELKAGASMADGDSLRLEFLLLDGEMTLIRQNATDQALETIRNRIDQFGVTEPVVVKQGENQILVQLPGVKEPQRALDLIGRTAQLEFKLVDEENISKVHADGIAPRGSRLFVEKRRNRETGVTTTAPILLKEQSVLTGDLLDSAQVKVGGEFANEPYVAIEFNSEGARLFDLITGQNQGKRLAIVLDDVVYSAPVIQERITGGKASITGAFTANEARDLAIVLRAGALPAPVKVIQNITIGPTLGQDSIRKGIRAALLGAALVILFMLYYYRLSGVAANIALLLNVLFLLGAFSILQATLTLPGIAGIILTMGMGVDTNVLIFERIREELRLGKTVRAAVEGGYSKAWLTIVDAHVTTLITSCALFTFGTGPIKGFAVTLSIGILINLFTAVFGSKVIFDWVIEKYKPRSLSI
jgi:protein-export membrane protein SecD